MTDQRTIESVAWANRVAAEDTIGPDLTAEQIASSKYAVTDRWSEKSPKARFLPKEDHVNVSYKFPPLLKLRLEKVAESTGLPEYRVVIDLLERLLAEETKLDTTISAIQDADKLSAKAWAAGTLARWRQKMEDARKATSQMQMETIITYRHNIPIKKVVE